jgi:hypothetical protein
VATREENEVTIIANGQLLHHWWGEYSASIGLRFATAALAAEAAPQLAPFHVSSVEPTALVFHGKGAELQAAERVLRTHGANMKKVGSLRFSIDHGEPFTIEVNLTPAGPQPDQLSLLSADERDGGARFEHAVNGDLDY